MFALREKRVDRQPSQATKGTPTKRLGRQLRKLTTRILMSLKTSTKKKVVGVVEGVC